MGICVILGSLFHDRMLEENGFKPVGERVSEQRQLQYGFCFFVLYSITLLVMVTST